MELPSELKDLYKHWDLHTQFVPQSAELSVNQEVLSEIEVFVAERMRIWEKKTSGQPQPFTNDQVLAKYRFCNIYRELDRQTIEIHQLLQPLQSDFPVWLLNILFCRLICNIETVKKVGLLSLDGDNNLEVFHNLKSLRSPKYGTAYVFPISAIMRSLYPTREEFFCLYLPTIAEKIAAIINTFDRISVVGALELILPPFKFNLRFHWTEVLIDVAYQFPERINLFKEFPIGPGSLPTMKSLSSTDPVQTCADLTSLGQGYLTYQDKKIYLSAENWEGIGCEFRKYTNLLLGTGRRRKYTAVL